MRILKNAIKWFLYSITRLGFRLLLFIPIDRDKYFFMSYAGKQYSCNPKAISEYLEEKDKKAKIVWVLSEEMTGATKYDEVKPRTFKFYYHYWTAKAIITNGIVFREIPIRKNQILINTWHGGGAYKRVVYDNPSIKRDWFEKRLLHNPDESRTCYLSSCSMASEYVIRSGLGHNGKILEIGSPRNDIFWKKDRCKIVKRVKEHYNLADDIRILLYAPTFRDSKNTNIYDIEYEFIKEALNRRFGGKWVVLVRMHQLITQVNNEKKYISATDYPDMQDLLVAADAFVTDYSSSIWDFCFAGKPAFLYTPDIDEYMSERNFYIDMNDWPYLYAVNTEQLVDIILKYDLNDANKRIENHLRIMGSFEDGNASEKVVKYIKGKKYE